LNVFQVKATILLTSVSEREQHADSEWLKPTYSLSCSVKQLSG